MRKATQYILVFVAVGVLVLTAPAQDAFDKTVAQISVSLRPRYGRVRYRILYFWHGEGTVVISHGFVKKTAAVPQYQIQRALDRKHLFE